MHWIVLLIPICTDSAGEHIYDITGSVAVAAIGHEYNLTMDTQ